MKQPFFKITVSWDATPCSLVYKNRCLKSGVLPNAEDGSNMVLQNIGQFTPNCKASHSLCQGSKHPKLAKLILRIMQHPRSIFSGQHSLRSSLCRDVTHSRLVSTDVSGRTSSHMTLQPNANLRLLNGLLPVSSVS